ncbi:MAG: DedA family protein [Gallionella sp.]
MKDFVNYLFVLFSQYGYGAVFFGVLLDIVGIPLAGELTLLLTGSMVANGALGWMPSVLVASSAALLNDSIWYGVGRLGAVRLVRIYCRLSFGSTACLMRTEGMLARFGPRSLLFARFVPGFRTFAAPISGISNLPIKKFIFYDGVGALLWSGVGVVLGALLVNKINNIVNHMEQARHVVLALVVVLLTLFILMKIWVRVRHGKAKILTQTALRGDGTGHF